MSVDASFSQPIALEYGAAPRARRKWVRRAIGMTVCGVLAFAAWHWGPSAWRQAQVLYWQTQCLNYRAPADQVVYEEDPTAAVKLLAGGGDYTHYGMTRRVIGASGA